MAFWLHVWGAVLTSKKRKVLPGKWAHVTAGASFLFAMGLATAAHAEDTEADRLFKEARAEMKAGRFGQGCTKFKESFQLDPTAGTMLNIGDCEEKQHHLAASFNAFARGLKMLPTTDARAPRTSERLTALASKLAWLKVTLPPDVEVLIDDNVVDAYEGKFALDPGDHAVRLRRANASDVLSAISARMGETKTLDSTALQQPNTTPIPKAWTTREPKNSVGTTSTTSWALDVSQPVEKPEGPSHTGAFVAFGIGGAGVAIGTVTGILALNAASVVKADCTPAAGTEELRCGARGADAAKRGKTTSTISTVAFGTAIAAGATGVILLLTGKPADTKKGNVRFVPMATDQAAGGFIVGTM